MAGGSESDAPAIYVATWAQILWDMGSLDTMVPSLEQAVKANPGVTGFRGILGIGFCAAGRLDDARAILRRELDTNFADHRLNPLWLITISLFASLCIELGDGDAAKRLYEIMDPSHGRPRIPAWCRSTDW